MQFGIICDRLDELDLITQAEALGYGFCWAFDSPMLRSNPFVLLALAARSTRQIRLGVGVAVAGLREAPELANAIASVNRIAPGRTFLGLGTGNTAMRSLGRRPMRLAPFANYVQVVRALLNGEAIDYRSDDGTHSVAFQNLEARCVETDPPVPVEVAGFGPRAQMLAGRIGDGLITGFPRGGTIEQALDNVRRGAEKADRTLHGFRTTALVNVMLLEPGETLSSARVVHACGPAIMANVHYLVDLARETGCDPPPYVRSIWDDYVAFHDARDAATRHQQLHQSHYAYLDPQEARFVTPELIRAFCIAGEPDDIVEQLRRLESRGLDAITFAPSHGQSYAQYEQFARSVMSRM